MQTLPRTKFIPPLPQREIIVRADLTAWLQNEIPVSRLVLVSAPAGYGKTTLLSSLPQALPDYRLAWLALDVEDNDPVRFLAGLGEALAAIDPRLKQSIENQLSGSAGIVSGSDTVLPLRQVMVVLINTILNLPACDCILVLDDLHEIALPAIYEALDYLIDNLPPQLHVVLSTRREPHLRLNALRARRQLVELDSRHLRFDLAESQRFLNGTLDLRLSEAEVSSLHQKTEGWPVGLVLLTNRLRSLPPPQERTAFLQQLERIDSNTFHYLADEVLAHQPEDIRSFLIETSILSELSPSLCQAVTGREDAAGLLTEIYQHNLFLTLVRQQKSTEEPLYRYHTLFAEFLQQELQQRYPGRGRLLHVRAADAEKEVPARAIAHLLAAQEWQAAALKIEAVGEQFLQEGLQGMVSRWIGNLPADLANARCRLMYLRGLSGLLTGEFEEAQSSLERSLQLLAVSQDSQDRTTHGQVLVHLASLAFLQAEFSISEDLIRRAEPYIAGFQERIEFLMLRSSLALFWTSDWQRAGQDLREAVELVRSYDDPRLWFLFSLYLAPEFTVLPGLLDLLEEVCQEAKRRYDAQITPLRLGMEDTWASIHLRRGRLRQAIETGQDALLVKEALGGYNFLGLNAILTVASAYAGLGNTLAAQEYLHKAALQAQETGLNQALTGGALYLRQGRLFWLEGRYEEARRIYQQLVAMENKLSFVTVFQKMLGGLLEISEKHYAQAESTLLEAVRAQSKEWVSEIYGSARLLLAYLYYRWDKPQEALAQMDFVMVRCEQNNTAGVILQDMPLVAPLLRLAAKKDARAAQALSLLAQMGLSPEEQEDKVGLLTMRQLEILRLMAAGYSNQAVADKLILSLATVKSHVVHIMNRLGASSRMEAVAKARDMRLL
ncbi:MAG: LuxR C-terminal-related transcriptional regulator [Anaerolineaceae bacterium]|nr:LuxR C-terminal-related transcriptional regulator [Anaerolineaceae bacterium]